MSCVVPIIDLFAGPGGLGEGFSSYDDSEVRFKIALSIEKDGDAHKTLQLRSFYRQFDGDVPEEYYSYVHGDISLNELYSSFPDEAARAENEAWLHELQDGDIDTVRSKVKKALSTHDSDKWVLIGGPPCQAYSVVGRARMKNHKVDFENDERHFLYKHYLRIVAHLSPSIFIMENVKGMLTASVNGEGIFEQILEDLEYPGRAIKKLDGRLRAPSTHEYDIYSLVVGQGTYIDENGAHVKKLKPKDYIIHSEKFGIPQRRHRVILLGVRKDIDPLVGARLIKSGRVNVEDVLDDLPKLRSGITKDINSWSSWKGSIEELFSSKIASQFDDKTIKVMKSQYKLYNQELGQGGLRVEKKGGLEHRLSEWYLDEKLSVVLNHQSKSHMKSDLWRYFFSSSFYIAHGRSPLLSDYPVKLLPKHKNATKENTKFLDRFKVQGGDTQASTLTSHISKDGHFFIHHDPTQCRAWSVREAARIQTFPDNYFFEGNRTAQYKQVGNAVPPLLAYQIAEVVAKYISCMK